MKERDLIFFTQWHMRCTLLRYVSRESCILSVRLLADLLGALGITAMPLATGAIALNKTAFERLSQGEDWDNEDDEDGGFGHRCIHKGMPSTGNWYTGHLVLLAGGRYLCDPSADQFAHPEKELQLVPLLIDLGDPDLPPEFSLGAFLDGEQSASAILPGGGVVSYDAHQDDLSYKQCMDWEDSVPGDRLYDAAYEATMGLVDLYRDATSLPDLPVLPRSSSAKREPEETAQREIRAAQELGYTPEELAAKIKREQEREQARASGGDRQ